MMLDMGLHLSWLLSPARLLSSAVRVTSGIATECPVSPSPLHWLQARPVQPEFPAAPNQFSAVLEAALSPEPPWKLKQLHFQSGTDSHQALTPAVHRAAGHIDRSQAPLQRPCFFNYIMAVCQQERLICPGLVQPTCAGSTVSSWPVGVS